MKTQRKKCLKTFKLYAAFYNFPEDWRQKK